MGKNNREHNLALYKMLKNRNAKYVKNKIRSVIQLHLNSDYRDPEPPPLPRLASVPHERPVCIPNRKKEDSVKEIDSNSPLWDTLLGMGMLRQRQTKTFMDFRNHQRGVIFNLQTMPEKKIKRLQMPASKYVIQELKADGFQYAAFKLKKLMQKHERLREAIPPEQIKDKPLKEMSKSIVFLGDILRQANIYKNLGQVEKEFSLYYHVGRHYETKNTKYWAWLANSFYKMAANTVKHFKQDNGYSKALINYMYGRFLLLQAKNALWARKRLQIAYSLSKGRPWGAMWTTNVNMEIISSYSSYLLHTSQLLVAKEISKVKPQIAVEFSKQAVKHARRGDWHPDLEEAKMDLAINYSKNKQHDEAILILEDLNNKVKPEDNREMYIRIQLLLVLCYKSGRRREKTMEQLFFIVGLGRKWGITELVAFGHKHIANYLILENRLVMARKYLTSCILLNKKLKNNDELLESLYLHGSCQAHLHFKEYIQLMLNTPTPEHPGFKKILEFITYGKPFWEVKNLKRYIVTKQIKPLIAHEKPLAASDKIYIVLKGIFGQEFADYAMEEITKFSNKVPFDQNCYLQEDPTECKYFEVREDAEDYRKFLQDKYQDRNKVLEKLYGENIFFEIEEREIEDDSEDVEYIKSMNAIDPIIPYAKDSPMHQQALNLIKKCTGRENVGKKKKVIIDATDPKVLIRLLNCIRDQGNVVFQFKGPINYEAIIQEMRRQREEQRKFVHSLPDLLHKRYSSEMPEQPVKKAVSIPFPQDDYDENYLEYETDEEIEKNRDILFNQDPSIMEKIISITKYMNENK